MIRTILKQLLRSSKRSVHTLPRLEGPLTIEGDHLINAALFDLLDA